MPITQHAMQVGEIAYHDYEGVALDLDERERIVADLGTGQFMILRNHGTLTVGGNCADAFMAMYYLERACTMQVRALAGGATPTHGEPIYARLHNPTVARFETALARLEEAEEAVAFSSGSSNPWIASR